MKQVFPLVMLVLADRGAGSPWAFRRAPQKSPTVQKSTSEDLTWSEDVGNISSCSGQEKRSKRSSHTGSHIPCGVLPGPAEDWVSTPQRRSLRSEARQGATGRPSALMQWWGVAAMVDTNAKEVVGWMVNLWAPKGGGSSWCCGLNVPGVLELRIAQEQHRWVDKCSSRFLGLRRSCRSSSTPTIPWRR